MSYDCDFEIKDMPTFLLINETIKKDIQNMLSILNLDLLPKPNKTQVEIKYLVYDNGMKDLDYYYLYLSIHNVIDSPLDTNKQILSNLIYYSNILNL